MNKKQNALKIKSMLIAILMKQSFRAKIMKTQTIDHKNFDYLPLKDVSLMPVHINVSDRKKNGFDIFCYIHPVSGAWGFELKINGKRCDALSLDDLSDIYKTAYNRVFLNKVINKSDEFVNYLQTVLNPKLK